MEPEHLRFGGGATETVLSPQVAVMMLIAIVLILALPRAKVLPAFLTAVFIIPIGQVVVLGSLHFTVLRILILAGLARRGSSSGGKFAGGFNGLDRVVVLWTVSELTILSLQWMEMQSLIHNLGDFVDALGGYLVIRFFIPNGEAIRRTIKVLAALCVILGACMINEQITHVNVFGYLGGIPLSVTVRDGSIRSGATMGGLYAGVFSGTLIPMFVWLWTGGKSRMTACVGLLAATVMVITSHSSTSLLALGASLLGLGFWALRKQMRLVRWVFSMILVTLHLVMKAPVWALIARVDLTGSSSGDHRFQLMDRCIRHFSDWWLFGYKSYNKWGWDMWDLCNQFIVVAVTGGLLTLVLYIAIFSRSFGTIGTARKRVEGHRQQEWLLWCLGSDLFAHVVSHFGINYMAQMQIALFPILACISVATFEASRPVVRNVKTPGQEQFAGVAPESMALNA